MDKAKQQITEEMGVHKQWYIDAKNQTPETLITFINHLTNDYNHDYGTICHAVTAASIAAAYAVNASEQGGITGFQAGAIMWEFITNWNMSHNKSGMRLVDYDEMLYPQYEYKFEKTISYETWLKLQEQARELIKTSKHANQDVILHWRTIASGVIPFGYKIIKK